MKHYYFYFSFLFFFLYCLSCSQKKTNKDVIAEIDGNCLYISEIKSILPIDCNKNDSIQIVEEYINNWKFKQLAYKNAREEIEDSTEIAENIENYRQQLYIDAYMNMLIDREINYSIDSAEIQDYYENYLNDYLLPSTYIKAHYIVFSANLVNYYHILEKMRKSTIDDYDMLKKFCIGTNREVVLKKEWTNLNDFLISINYSQRITDEELPYKDIIDFVTQNRRIVVKIDDYALKGGKVPFDLIKDEIVQIIINNRKRAKYLEIKNKIIKKNV